MLRRTINWRRLVPPAKWLVKNREAPLRNVNLEQLVELTNGFSGANIERTITTAKKRALERHIASVSKNKKELAVTNDDLASSLAEVSKRKH